MNSMEIKSMNVFIELNGIKTFVIGESNSGKTYMLKKIMNKIDNSDILINGKPIKEIDINFLKHNIAVVLNDNNFNCDLVKEEINYSLNKLNIDIEIDNFIDYFEIKDLLEEKIEFLSLEQKMYIKILSLIIINPKLLCIDGLYEYLNNRHKKLIDAFIKENNISLLNVISNLENLDFKDNIIVLNNKNAIYCGSVLSVLKGNTILPYMGYKLPFITDLTQNLVLYKLLDKTETSSKKVVDLLWK